jgi:conserved hypothetical protein, YceG family
VAKQKKAARGRAQGIARALLIAAAALVVAAAAGALALGAAASRPVAKAGLFTLERGANVHTVALALEREGYLRSALTFRILAKIEGQESSLKAGTYRIETSMNAKRILDEMASGEQALAKATIPEGYTTRQVAALLDSLGVVSKEAFLSAASSPELLAELGLPGPSAEGYLFPDTYYFPLKYTAKGVIESMVADFRAKLATIPGVAALTPKELGDKVVLASIVEREYKLPEEAPLMASVFANRLKIHMGLQSCATVVYIITERQGKSHPEALFDRDLKIVDPYNTYMYAGLPPGAISNPGLTALNAAINPASTKYLYFRLVDAEAGSHHFSLTLEEHLGAKVLLIKKKVQG